MKQLSNGEKLSKIIMEETAQDLFGKPEKTYNGTGLLVGCVAWLIALVCVAVCIFGFWLLVSA